MTEERVSRIEKKYCLHAVESNQKWQFYLLDEYGKIGIVFPKSVQVLRMPDSQGAAQQNGYDHVVSMTKEQAKAFMEEFRGILEVFE